MPKTLSGLFLLEGKRMPVDPNLARMIQQIKMKCPMPDEVFDIFRVIDRKFFMNENEQEDMDMGNNLRSIMIAAAGGGRNPYADSPKPIGWNTTISAPSMHAETFKYLFGKMKTA